MPYDENGDWYEEDQTESDGGQYAGEAVSYSGGGGSYAPQEMAAEDRGGITPVIVHGEGGPAEYNGQLYRTADQASSARALGVHNSQTPDQQLAMQQGQQQMVAQQPPNSIQMQEDIDRTQLSRNEQLELTTTQNGIARLQRDARVGLIPPQQAAQMMQQLQARAQPLMIRQSQLRGMMMAQQYQAREEQMMQASAAEARRATFLAANAAGSTLEHRDADGRVFARSIVGPDGRLQTINNPEPRPTASARPERPPVTADSVLRELGHGGGRSSSGSSGGTGMPGETPAPPTPEEIDATIERQVGTHARVADRLERQARLEPGGDLPFDPIDKPERDWTWTETGQQRLNDAIRRADQTGQRDRSRLLRRVGDEIRSGRTTGQLTPEQQQTLRDTGYYHGEFTPALDRELGRIESERRERVGTGVTQVTPPTAAEREAARTIRNLLGRYGTMAAMQRDPNAFAQFQGQLAAIRVFNWGRNQEEQKTSRAEPNDAVPAGPRPRPRAETAAEYMRRTDQPRPSIR
jgi:hypothetical protein